MPIQNINVSFRDDGIILEEKISIDALQRILGYSIELKSKFFNLAREYGECNIVAPLLNLRRYLVAIEVRILGKQPDMIAIAPDFLVGKRFFYEPIFAPIMVLEAKAGYLREDDLKDLTEYVNKYKHVFLIVNDETLKSTNKHLLKEIFKLYNNGNISIVIVSVSGNDLHVRYVSNYSSLDNINSCAETLGSIIRKELMDNIRRIKMAGLELNKKREVFNKSLRKYSSLFRTPVSYASNVEDALQKSGLTLLFPSNKLCSIYSSGHGHLLSLVTYSSVFLLSPASGTIKLPHLFLLNEMASESLGRDDKTIDDMVRNG